MVRHVAVLSAAAALMAAAPAHAAKVTVGPSQSIQAAVDAAKPGTTIVVTGKHAENVAITTDNIKLRGKNGATLTPAATPLNNACLPLSAPDVNGICVLGQLDPQTGDVTRSIKGVEVSGFNVAGFSIGIVAFGAKDADFEDNAATDNEDYGITAFSSTGTKMVGNVASDAGESAFYIGDSPKSNVEVRDNDASNSLFGILVRNARKGKIEHNNLHGNCDGIVFLADAPGPTGDFHFAHNTVASNTKACAAGEDLPFPLSGVGVALLGADKVNVDDNVITGNVPSEPTAFSGGVVIASGGSGTPPAHDDIHNNLLRGNSPNIFSDGTGIDIRIHGNRS